MKYAINKLELLAVVWGLEHFRHIYGKPIELLTDHQALEPLIKRNIKPKSLRTTIFMLLDKGHAAINKMTTAAKPFWWPRMTRENQQKCDECIPCKMAGKNIKPQLPLTEINYLPLVEKRNQEIQLDFIGPIRFKHRRF